MSRNSASTRARKKGYEAVFKLRRFLSLFLKLDMDKIFEGSTGWRDYMHRHIPVEKRGGPPNKQPSKRKRQKKKDRSNTIRRNNMDRYRQLERLLDRDDLTDEEFDLYNKELNDLQDQKNKREAIQAKARAERLAEQEQEKELEFINSLTEEVVEKMYIDTCLKYQDVNGVSFKSWYEQSLKYYTIDKNFVVHSRARSAKTVDSVQCNSIGHAKYRILQLIKWKFRDHAERGHDFAWDIDG